MNATLYPPFTPLLDEIKHALNGLFESEWGDPVLYVNPLTLQELTRESIAFGVYWPTGKKPIAWSYAAGTTCFGFPVCVDFNQKVGTVRFSSQKTIDEVLAYSPLN